MPKNKSDKISEVVRPAPKGVLIKGGYQPAKKEIIKGYQPQDSGGINLVSTPLAVRPAKPVADSGSTKQPQASNVGGGEK